MTTPHLTESELADLAEDTLNPRRAAHVETCEDCRAQGSALRVLLGDTAGVAVPEPSPLFWDHLSARVRESVAAESRPRRFTWEWEWAGAGGFLPLAAAAAVLVAVMSGVWLLRGLGSSDPALSSRGDRVAGAASVQPGASAGAAAAQPGASAGAASFPPGALVGAASADLGAPAIPNPENSEVWDLLTTAASGVGLDEAHAAGMRVQPAAIDHAVLDLSPAELTELGRLLQTEMRRASN